jgi:hypothetical protein
VSREAAHKKSAFKKAMEILCLSATEIMSAALVTAVIGTSAMDHDSKTSLTNFLSESASRTITF